MRDLAVERVRLDRRAPDAVRFELPYDAVPPELRVAIAPREWTLYPMADQDATFANTYKLSPQEVDPLTGRITAENTYVEVGGFIRLKQKVERRTDGTANVLDVRHDAQGFPTESTRKVEGKLRGVVRNTFDSEGRPSSQQRTTIGEGGTEVTKSITYVYQPAEHGFMLLRSVDTIVKDAHGKIEQRDHQEGTGVYMKDTGYQGGEIVDSLYA